jgi:DNA-binding NarL/FixJ family response regulator
MPYENRADLATALELLVQAQIARGDIPGARAAVEQLEALAANFGTLPLRASARIYAGLVAAAHQANDAACRCLEDAVDLFVRVGAPFETAQARVHLARSLFALGRHRSAARQADTALRVFDGLGADPERARAAALLEEIESASSAHGHKSRDPARLTPRELQVIRLIAAGQSNQEIAAQLVLSLRTVERHISNIYDKIGAAGTTARATATAYALRHDLNHPPLK